MTTETPQSQHQSYRSPRHQRSAVGDDNLLTAVLKVIIPLLILGIGVFIFFKSSDWKPNPKRPVEEVGPPRVFTSEVTNYEEPVTIDVDGSVVPFREIALACEVAGRIKDKSEDCRAGNFVEEGDLLFEIDPVDYRLEKNRLTKEVRRAEISLHEVDVEADNNVELMKLAAEDVKLQKSEVSRLQKLVAQRASSRTELDRAKRSEVGARNQLQSLKNTARLLVARRARLETALELAGTQLEKAELDLTRTKIVAPVSGVIVQELVEEDSFVQPGSTLLRIEDTSRSEVLCNFRVDQIGWLWGSEAAESAATAGPGGSYDLPQAPAKIIFRMGDDEFYWQGRMDRYEGSGLDRRTRTVPCRIVVPDPKTSLPLNQTKASRAVPPALVRGMFVTVRLEVPAQENLVRIPTKALRPGGQVWVADGDKLRTVSVKVARRMDDGVLLESGGGIEAGEAVVVTPVATPYDGMTIEAHDESQAERLAAEDLAKKEALAAAKKAETEAAEAGGGKRKRDNSTAAEHQANENSDQPAEAASSEQTPETAQIEEAGTNR